jgi:hypothetical protein
MDLSPAVRSRFSSMRTFARIRALATVVATFAAAPVAIAVPSLSSGETIAPRLQAEMDRNAPGSTFTVIVHMREQADIRSLSAEMDARGATMRERHGAVIRALQGAAGGQDRLKAELPALMRNGGVLGYTSYWIRSLLVLEATAEAIQEIARRDDVEAIEPNFEPELIPPIDTGERSDPSGDRSRGIGVTPGLRAIHAPEVWRLLGITGAGRLIGGFDTGVDGAHPALAERWRGADGTVPWQECWLDLLGTATQFPVDSYGHGTHTMGTMIGLGAATGDTIGVAWGAKWIAANPCGQNGMHGGPFENDALTAFQWFADPDGDSETIADVPDVVENSWGTRPSLGYPPCFDLWWQVMDNCEAAGVVLVFSGGNEGPGSGTMGSPADRPTTIYNAFSVGAVDATHYEFPYPIASWSSRGPSTCTGAPPENLIKPEVVAPGVNVYSSVPGGGYEQDIWSGTSMSGPHVAGIVALMRQANPDLSVDQIKQILLQTSRDEGPAGDDNAYGRGFVDAYAAVMQAIEGFAGIQGVVTNGSWHDLPISGASVTLIETGVRAWTDANGAYQGVAPIGTYHIEASHPSFRPDTAEVTFESGQTVIQDFHLIDETGPSITSVSNPVTQPNEGVAVLIHALVSDPSTVAAVTLRYRINGNGWIDTPMAHGLGDLWSGTIPGHSRGTQIDFHVVAIDGLGNAGASPADAPDSFYTVVFTRTIFADTAESDMGWSLQAAGDNATSGRWIRDDPVGTVYLDHPCQPEDDHTPSPGVKCFVTGNTAPGGDPSANDVDGGCTTLTTPAINPLGASRAFVSFWRWWAQEAIQDDQFQIDGSSDGGLTWIPLERIGPAPEETWKRDSIELGPFLSLAGSVMIRFKACDLNQGAIVEAAVDDFALETFNPSAAGAQDATHGAPRPSLAQNEPNPFHPATTIRFRMSSPAPARLEIYDASGRLVRTLVDEPLEAGSHAVVWNGFDDLGHAAGAGVYFYRLRAGAFEQSRRMTILK